MVTETRAILEGAVSIEIIVLLVLEMENKYSGAQLRFITVYSKALTQIPTQATLLQTNTVRCAMQYPLILQAEVSVLYNRLKSKI